MHKSVTRIPPFSFSQWEWAVSWISPDQNTPERETQMKIALFTGQGSLVVFKDSCKNTSISLKGRTKCLNIWHERLSAFARREIFIWNETN